MAERRMFAKSVIGSARFLRMPPSSRLLYYDLGMSADDDGIVEAFAVMRTTGATEDDLRVLCSKGFVKVLNEDLVTYITDWKRNNLIKTDRYHKSVYSDLLVKIGDGTNLEPIWNQMGSNLEPEVSIGKDRLGKVSIGKDSLEQEEYTPSVVYSSCSGALLQSAQDTETKKTKPSRFIPPTVDQVKAYCEERGNGIDPQRFVDFYSSKGWMVGKNKMKDWRAAIRGWECRNTPAPAPQQPQQLSGGDRILEMIRRGEFDE